MTMEPSVEIKLRDDKDEFRFEIREGDLKWKLKVEKDRARIKIEHANPDGSESSLKIRFKRLSEIDSQGERLQRIDLKDVAWEVNVSQLSPDTFSISYVSKVMSIAGTLNIGQSDVKLSWTIKNISWLAEDSTLQLRIDVESEMEVESIGSEVMQEPTDKSLEMFFSWEDTAVIDGETVVIASSVEEEVSESDADPDTEKIITFFYPGGFEMLLHDPRIGIRSMPVAKAPVTGWRFPLITFFRDLVKRRR